MVMCVFQNGPHSASSSSSQDLAPKASACVHTHTFKGAAYTSITTHPANFDSTPLRQGMLITKCSQEYPQALLKTPALATLEALLWQQQAQRATHPATLEALDAMRAL
mmetsp:Transcript_14707/g.39724  ORF Transcript_14707/g.39724 Transcript_14707/m.39724 type:complete len:108 (+) Transcript_14707:179-502(+)